MQDIETQAIQTYQQNIQFLQQKHADVFQKLQNFESALAEGTYLEQYTLEYKDGYFDVKEQASNNFLYARNSIDFSKELSSLVNYSKRSFIFDGLAMFQDYELHKDEFDDKLKGLEGVYPIMSYYLHNMPKEAQMQEIEKFIFIGVGLGLHIPITDKNIHALEYFIIEDDLELFRLSLFTTPYYKIEGQITFSINENKEEFTHSFKQFLSNSFFRNKYLKYLYFTAHSNEKIKLIKNALASQVFASFPYRTLLEKYTRQLQYMKMHYNFIDFSKQFLPTDVSTKPLLIVAAGPSFSKQLQWLEKNHEHFIIMAVSAVLNKLHEKNIIPDIVTHLDGFEISKEHLKGYETEQYLKNTLLLAGSFTPLYVLQKFQKENVFIMEELSTEYHKGFNSHTGPCVGSTSIFQAILMNFQEIYTLGVDLALDEKGHSHASSHSITDTQYDNNELDNLNSSISFRGDFFTVKGNFKEKVYTNPLFYSSLQSIHEALKLLKNDTQNVYNLSDGAYMQGSIPTDIDTVTVHKKIDKKSLHTELHHLLTSHSTRTLSNQDINSLKERLAFAQHIHSVLVHYKNSPLPKQKENYLHQLISLILDTLIEPTRENAPLVNVYDYFLSYTIPIIFDFFNTQELNNIPQHIENFDKLLLDEMFNICNIYTQRIEDFLQSIEAN